MGYDIDWINKEDWREAPGVIAEGTNSALAKRDYSIPCHAKYCVVVIKGYWIWWCSIHHQPHSHCEHERLKK